MPEATLSGLGPSELVDHLTLANVYFLKFSAERVHSDGADSFEVHIEPFHQVADGRIDYLYIAKCAPVSQRGERVALIETAVIATFDVDPRVEVGKVPLETIEWCGENLALFAAYPYLREAIQAHATRLGLPNITMDLLKRGEPLPQGLVIGNLPEGSVQ